VRLIHADATERDYTLLRAWILGLWLFEVLRNPIGDLDRLPAAGYVPPEVFQRAIPGDGSWLVQAGVPDAVQWSAVVVLVVSMFARRWALAVAVAAVLVTVHQGLTRSFSYVFHPQLALLYGLYAIVLFDVARALIPARARASQEAGSSARSAGSDAETVSVWAVPYLGVLGALCLTYSFTGVYRITHGGPALFFSDALEGWLVHRPLVFGQGMGQALVGLPAAPIWLGVGFAVVTLFEALALFALVSPRFRLWFVVVMVGFHVSTYAFMGIAFWQNLLLFPLFFERVRPSWRRSVGGSATSGSREVEAPPTPPASRGSPPAYASPPTA
jgi:hypothetical protein